MTDPIRWLTVAAHNLLKELNCLLDIFAIVKRSEPFHTFQDKNLWEILCVVKDMIDYFATCIVQPLLIPADKK